MLTPKFGVLNYMGVELWCCYQLFNAILKVYRNHKRKALGLMINCKNAHSSMKP